MKETTIKRSTQYMGSLPTLRFPDFQTNLESSKMASLGKFSGGGTPDTTKKNYWKGEIPWISSSDIQEDNINEIKINRFINEEAIKESATKIIPANSILFVSRVGVGKLAITKTEICTSQDFANFIPKKLNSHYLGYYFLSNNNLLKRYSQGTSIKGLTTGDIKSIKVAIPTLPEQQKIASFLSSVDNKLDQLKKKKELLEQYKIGMMQKIFKQEIRFKDEDGKGFPEWEEKKLGKITTLLKDGSHGSHMDDPEGCHYLLSAKNIMNGSITIDSNDRRISETEYNSIYKNYKLQRNDLLLSIVGSIGRVAKYKNEENVVFQRSVAFFRFPKYNPDFMLHLMISENFQKELNRRKVVSAQPGIYLGDLAKISMRIPSLNEQNKIAGFLSAIDDKIDLSITEIDKSNQFRKGLLQQMFV